MQTQVELVHDKELEEDSGLSYGKYMGTFVGDRGQVRADLFDDGEEVIAYISFPTGLDVTNVEDRYVGILEEYAISQGFGNRFHLIYEA
ncbi:MAG: hypothetical protein ACLQGP_08875 [Isosphaeraceae bacterium]